MKVTRGITHKSLAAALMTTIIGSGCEMSAKTLSLATISPTKPSTQNVGASPSPTPTATSTASPKPSVTPTPSATPSPSPTSGAPSPTPTAVTALGSIDTVIASMPSNSWKALPGTMMQDACPQPLNHYACGFVQSAWGGGDYDQRRDRMIVYGGGHSDSWYNNVFSFDFVNMKWERLSEMPGDYSQTPPSWWVDIRTESCGFHTKGTPSIPDSLLTPTGYVDRDKCFQEPVLSQLDLQQPRSIHTYGGVTYDRIGDRYCVFSTTATYPSGQAAYRSLNCFSPITRQWTRATDIPDSLQAYRTTALDAAGNVWTVPLYNGNIAKYNPTANSWTSAWPSNYDSPGSPDVDRKRNLLTVLLHDQSTGRIRQWNLNSLTDASYTTLATTGEAPPINTQAPGFVYADSLDRFYAWTGGLNMYVLDPSTATWTRKAATGDDPGAGLPNGTYNRFRFVQSRGVFILVNGTDKNVYIYKP